MDPLNVDKRAKDARYQSVLVVTAPYQKDEEVLKNLWFQALEIFHNNVGPTQVTPLMFAPANSALSFAVMTSGAASKRAVHLKDLRRREKFIQLLRPTYLEWVSVDYGFSAGEEPEIVHHSQEEINNLTK